MSRRSILQFGAASLFGLNLPKLFAASSKKGKSVNSVIVVYMQGGPSHIDTYDPKPNASSLIRGVFTPAETKVPDFLLGQYFGMQAAIAHELFVVRSYTHRVAAHEPARLFVTTGQNTFNRSMYFPSIGSVASYHLNRTNHPAPYFLLGSKAIMDLSGIGNQGILNDEYEPRYLEGDPRNAKFVEEAQIFSLANGITMDRLQSRKQLLSDLDVLKSQSKLLSKADSNTQKAFEVLTQEKVANALDLQKESSRMHDFYGESEIGKRLLLARRLIQAGVHFVLVEHRPPGFNELGWDHHGRIFEVLPKVMPPFDKALAALIVDLRNRGLLANTLVLAFGEFGRDPKINSFGGRHHWPQVGSIVAAGGGLPGGTVFGSSNRTGEEVASNPVSPQDLVATVYDVVGIPSEASLLYKDGARSYHPRPEGGRSILSRL